MAAIGKPRGSFCLISTVAERSIIYLSAFPISSFCSVPMTETCFLLRL